ncbi:MAG: hypothetical protein V1886_01915 [archaeon]
MSLLNNNKFRSKMHTIGFNGKKLLEAVCFEGVKDAIISAPVPVGKYSVENLINSEIILSRISDSIKDSGDSVFPMPGYQLSRAIVGEKNAIYITILDGHNDKDMLMLEAKGKPYSIARFNKEIKEYDQCVNCGSLTPYKKSTHVDERENYVEGAGQICKTCGTEIYGKEQGETKNE